MICFWVSVLISKSLEMLSMIWFLFHHQPFCATFSTLETWIMIPCGAFSSRRCFTAELADLSWGAWLCVLTFLLAFDSLWPWFSLISVLCLLHQRKWIQTATPWKLTHLKARRMNCSTCCFLQAMRYVSQENLLTLQIPPEIVHYYIRMWFVLHALICCRMWTWGNRFPSSL